MRELSHLLRELDPPPGGLQRLQQTIAARESSVRPRPYRARLVALGCTVLAAMLMAWQLPGLLATRQRTTMLQDALQQAMAPSNEGVRVRNGSALELPSGQPNARVYLVQTTTP